MIQQNRHAVNRQPGTLLLLRRNSIRCSKKCGDVAKKNKPAAECIWCLEFLRRCCLGACEATLWHAADYTPEILQKLGDKLLFFDGESR